MKTCWQLAVLILALPLEGVSAKCLPNSDPAHPCRCFEGDSWCAEQGNGNPYAYSDNCLELSSQALKKPQPDVSGLAGLRQGMDYSQARQIVKNAGWQGNNRRWQDIPNWGQENDVYFKNGWREVAYCAGTGTAPCGFEFHDIHGNLLVIITEGECLNAQMEELKDGETCDLSVAKWFLE